MAKKKKPDDEDKPGMGDEAEGAGADDSFGLPDIEYQPLSREVEQPAAETPSSGWSQESSTPESSQPDTGPSAERIGETEQPYTTYSSYLQEEKSSVAGKVIGIIVVVLLAAAAVWYFAFYGPAQEKEKQRLAQIQTDSLKRVQAARDAEAARQRALKEAEQRRADSLAALPKAGAIETLTDRTGRYYVVVASAIDDDLLLDHAKKLSKDNVSSKIIPPFGKYRFYRLAVADGDSFSAAQNTANELKPTYGDALWVLRY